jgi:hypothetical protein
MSWKSILAVGAGLALPLLAGPGVLAARESIVVDEGTAEPAGIAGHRDAGSTVTLRRPGGGALLHAIGGGERGGNEPCYVELRWKTLTLDGEDGFATRFWQPPCTDERRDYEESSLGLLSYARGIAEIQACTNGNDRRRRLKGVRITAVREVRASGVADVSDDDHVENGFVRANCADWSSPSRCDAGKVAVGLNIVHGADGVTGLQLVCAAARLVPDPLLASLPHYALDQREHVTTAPSGFPGTVVRVGAPASADFGVDQIVSREQRDHPCSLEVRSQAVREALMIDNPHVERLRRDRVDLCGGATNLGDAVAVTPSPADSWWAEHRGDVQQVFVSGVRACMNGDATRLKGIEVRGRRILVADDRRVTVEAVPVDPDDGRGARRHCDEGNWRPWIECPAGQVASALVAHFEAGDEPRSVTGLALECRRVVAGGATASR